MASTREALGEGTGIPAAMGAILVGQGKVTRPGVLPPEAAFNPLEFLQLVPQVLRTAEGDGAFSGFLVERIDENGAVERVDLPFPGF